MAPPPAIRTAALAMCALAVSGCATWSDDGGLDEISKATLQRTGHGLERRSAGAQDRKIARLLEAPLSADAAVQLALLHNKELHAKLADLGASEAELVQAGLLRNPGLTFGHTGSARESEINRVVLVDLAGLLTMPMRLGIERRRFEHGQLQLADYAVQLAAHARRAYFNAVAAHQALQLAEAATRRALAAAERAQPALMHNEAKRLDYLRERVAYAETAIEQTRAADLAMSSRELLGRILGLSAATPAMFKLPDRLPDLPASTARLTDLEPQAMQQRLDLRMARREIDTAAALIASARPAGLLNVLDAAYVNKSATDVQRTNGYEVSLELPLFDRGQARTRKAQYVHAAAVHRAEHLADVARSEVRMAYSSYRSTHGAAALYRDKVLPLREKIRAELGSASMQSADHEAQLAAHEREQGAVAHAALEALRVFWVAETDLHVAVQGHLGGRQPSAK